MDFLPSLRFSFVCGCLIGAMVRDLCSDWLDFETRAGGLEDWMAAEEIVIPKIAAIDRKLLSLPQQQLQVPGQRSGAVEEQTETSAESSPEAAAGRGGGGGQQEEELRELREEQQD